MKQKAFTLVELLCVAALTGVLALFLISFVKKSLSHEAQVEQALRARHNAVRALDWVAQDVASRCSQVALDDMNKSDVSGRPYLSFFRWSEDVSHVHAFSIDAVLYVFSDGSTFKMGPGLYRCTAPVEDIDPWLHESVNVDRLSEDGWCVMKVWPTLLSERLRLPMIQRFADNSIQLSITYVDKQNREHLFTKMLTATF